MEKLKYNIIFLDIDGVLNSAKFAEDHYKKTGKSLFMYDYIDPDAVDKFDRFMSGLSSVKLVITSSWRKGNVYDTISFFEGTGMKKLAKYVVGITPRIYSGGRGDEIKWFIDNLNKDTIGDFVSCDFEIGDYVIVDDETFDIQDTEHLVVIDNFCGITDTNLKEIKKRISTF